jgi:hypothetical protein
LVDDERGGRAGAPALQKTEGCEQRVRPLSDHFKGLFNLGHDTRRIHQSDIRNIPYLNRLADGVNEL